MGYNPSSTGAELSLSGATSGKVSQFASATTISYSIFWPSAQAAGSNYVLVNDGSGNLSWIPNSGGSVTAVTASPPLASSGGTTPNITISLATISTNGYLSSTDWNTFNSKSPALTFNAPLVNSGNVISFTELLPVNAQCVYVNVAGNDTTGNGTYDRPYATIGKALLSLTDSTSTKPYIVHIEAGTYSESGLEIPIWVFLVGSSQQPTKIIDSSGSISINSSSFSSGSERIGLDNLNLINSTGLTFNFQSIGGSGSNQIYLNNLQVAGPIVVAGRGSDHITGFNNRFFGSYTSSAMQEYYSGGYFAGTTAFNTTGVTGVDNAPEFVGIQFFSNLSFTSSGGGNTTTPTMIGSAVSGTLTIDQATSNLSADDVSLNAGTLSQTNGGLITYLSLAKYIGYSPSIPGNWSPTPTQVASALDQLAARPTGTTQKVDKFTLNGTDITNKFVTLSFTPSPAGNTILLIEDAGNMFYGVDFTVTGNQLGWNTLALDGILSSGDNLTITYPT